MIKFINRFILLLLVPGGIFSFLAYHDIDRIIPFAEIIMTGMAGLIGLLLLIKIITKWQAMLFIKKREKDLLYKERVGAELGRRVLMHELLDIGLYGLIGGFLLYTVFPAFYLGIVLAVATVEGILFLIINKGKYQVGITSKAVIIATNRPDIIRVTRLKAVLNKDGNYDFQLRDGRVSRVESNWILPSSRAEFNSILTRMTKEKGIFFDDFNPET